jgi:hypothetical protein
VAWRYQSASNPYADGVKSLYDSDTSTWTNVAGDDLLFEVGIEVNASSVALPSGYTKKCFLGWVFNNAAGNFVEFLQVGTSRRSAGLVQANDIITTLDGSPFFVDMYFILPPRKILKAAIMLTGTGTSTAVCAIGDLRATDISSAGDSVGAQIILQSSSTTGRPSDYSEVFVQSSGMMVHGTDGGELWLAGFSW